MTRAAVQNWIARKVLPPHLRPFTSAEYGVPMWRREQLPALRAWNASRPKRLPARKARKKTVNTGQERRLRELEQFLATHESVVTTALEIYDGYMREEAGKLRDYYDSIKDDPEKVAAQDQTRFTTHGVRMSAEVFDDSAKRARRALAALRDITEGDDDDE